MRKHAGNILVRAFRALLLLAFCSSAIAQTSSLVFEGTDGTLGYGTYTNRGQANAVNVVPDWSRCGYKGGGVEIPFVPAAVTINAPTGGDDTALIQDAIAQVSARSLDANGFRGALLIKAGNYKVGSTLFINASGVVIRGEGSKATGGTKITMTATVQDDLFDIRGTGYYPSVGSRVTITNAFVPSGAKAFDVSSVGGYAVGTGIRITYLMNQTWINDIGMDTIIDPIDGDESWLTSTFQLKFDRVVTAITNTTLYMDAPLVQTIENRYGGAVVDKLGTSNGRILNVGIEALRLESTYTNDTDEAHGWNAISMNDVKDVWVRQVTAKYFGYSCVKIDARSSQVTVEDSAMVDPKSITTGGRKYSFAINDCQHVLMQRCYTWGGRHDFTSNSKTPGPNAFVDGFAENTFNDVGPHMWWITGELYDNIKCGDLNVQNRWDWGTGHGWAGAQIMFWNCNASGIVCDAPVGAMNWSVGCVGPHNPGDRNSVAPEPDGIWQSHNTHVTPRSLYYRQLQERVGREALRNVILPSQEKGTIWTELDAWAGQGLFGSNVIAWTAQTLIMPPTNTVALSGRIRNLQMLERGATSLWSKVAGPGSVVFGNATNLQTTANFSTQGNYVLRLTVGDGTTSASYALNVRYGNTAPVVSAGTNQTLTLVEGVGLWTPVEITTRAWYDAADSNSITMVSGKVSQWRDKSGNNNHALQSTVTNRPTMGSVLIGGLNTVSFRVASSNSLSAADSASLKLDSSGGANVFSVYKVGQFVAQGSYANVLVSKGQMIASLQSYGVFGTDGNVRYMAATNVQLNVGMSAGTTLLLSGVRRDSEKKSEVYVDGVLTSSVQRAHELLSDNTDKLYIGRDSNAARHANADIGEIVIVPGELTTVTRQRLEGYLAHKWGMAKNLPADHPYKDAPPMIQPAALAMLDGTASDAEIDPLVTTWSKVSGPGDVTFGNPSAVDTTVTFNTKGVYTLRLTVSDGYGQSTADCVITVNEISIHAPTALAALAFSGTRIDLTWTDNSTNETGFAIERSAISGSGFVLLGTAAANAISYSDTSVTAGQTWFYRVVATNATESSVPSAEASATTPALPETVTFDANGGSTAIPASKQVTPGSMYGTLATTTRTGHTFKGWFTAASGGTEVTSATLVITETDHTLYAQWSASSMVSAATKHFIRGESETNTLALGYYQSVSSTIGTQGSTGSREDRNTVFGFTLPTLPVGATLDTATFNFEITAARDTTGGQYLPSLHAYLLNTADPTGSGTNFYYHGTMDPSVNAEQIGSTSVTIASGVTTQVVFSAGQEVRSFSLSNDALTLLKSFYNGHTPTQSTAYVRFNLSADPLLTTYRRYLLNTTAAGSSLQLVYTAPPSGDKLPATVTLNNLSQTYDGTARTVTATTEPVGLTVDVTYNGNASAPTHVGSYAVTGTVVSATYEGWANGTLVVSQATPTITNWPTTTAIRVGQALSNATLTGGSTSVPGTFSYDTPAATPPVGVYTAAVTFVAIDVVNYVNVPGTVPVTINTNALPIVNAGTNQTIMQGSALWTPAQIATRAWYDAADTNTITIANGKVSQWSDKSGNTKHLTQDTADNRPIIEGTINGISTVGFDGTNDVLYHAGTLSIEDQCVTVVGQIKTSVTLQNKRLLNMQYGTTNYFAINTRTGGSSIKWQSNIDYTASGSETSYKHFIMGASIGTNRFDGYFNGTITAASKNLTPLISITNFSVGGTATAAWCGMYAAEVIVHGAADRQKIEGYLAHKWGMATNLPASHPYRLAPPTIPEVAVANLDGTVSDPESDPLTNTWSKVSGPGTLSFGSISTVDTTATFSTNGVYTLRLTANDGFDTSYEECIITVMANQSPVWSGSLPLAASEIAYGATLVGVATDANGDPLTFIKISGPAWLTVSGTGTLSGTPTRNDIGLNTFVVNVSDGKAPAVQGTLPLYVRDARATLITIQ